MTDHTTENDRIGFCSLCRVVVSRYHADHPGEFHAIPPVKEADRG